MLMLLCLFLGLGQQGAANGLFDYCLQDDVSGLSVHVQNYNGKTFINFAPPGTEAFYTDEAVAVQTSTGWLITEMEVDYCNTTSINTSGPVVTGSSTIIYKGITYHINDSNVGDSVCGSGEGGSTTSPPIQVVASASPSEGEGPLTVTLSYEADVSYATTATWTIGSMVLLGSTVTVTLTEPGTYQAGVLVVGRLGAVGKGEVTVNVKAPPIPPPPTVRIFLDQPPVVKKKTPVTFIAIATGDIESYTWFLPGGEVLHEITSFTRRFKKPGVYKVSVLVIDRLRRTATDEVVLTVVKKASRR